MKVINREYLKLITQAKTILKDIDNYKMDIANMAIKACTIKLGGHIRGFYSVANFADDIGLNRKTLSCWIHSRKIQKELAKKRIIINDETQLNNIRKILRGDHTRGVSRVDKYSDTMGVIDAYRKSKSVTKEDREICWQIDRVKILRFKLSSLVLSTMSKENLMSLRNVLNECVEIIEQKTASQGDEGND